MTWRKGCPLPLGLFLADWFSNEYPVVFGDVGEGRWWSYAR
jgi:hypothetical protein